MRHDESKIQVSICQWLQENGYYFFAVSNEAAGSNQVRSMQFVSMGLRAGVSDLVVVLPAGRVVFLEVKAPDGVQSDKQKKFQARVESMGHRYFIAKSVQDVIDKIILLD